MKMRLLIILLALFATPTAAETWNSPRAVIAEKFAAVNRHAVDDIVALYAEDAEIIASDFCTPRHGRADVERTYRAIFAAVPDAIVDVQEYVVDGERVAVRFSVSSSIPGRAFSAHLMNFFTVRHGLIVRDEGIFDNRGQACKP